MVDLPDIAPYLEGAFLAETMQDWVQTTHFLRDSSAYERNPLLGRHPSQSKMTAFGVGADALQYEGYRGLPDKWKLPYAALFAGIEGVNIYGNKKRFSHSWDKPSLALGAILTAILVRQKEQLKESRKNLEEKYKIGLALQPKGAMATFQMSW